MTQIMILKRDAIENVPRTPPSVGVEYVHEWRQCSDRLGIRSVDCPHQRCPPPHSHVRNPKIRICLHCRLRKLQDEKLVTLFLIFFF